MAMDDLLIDCGGFGKFQIIFVCGIFIHKVFASWSMFQMSYVSYIPDWYCAVDPALHDYFPNQTKEMCSLNNTVTGSQEDCQHFKFEGSYRTAVTEWDLLCDRKWITPLLASIQMVGVLVGAILAGQLSDLIGRKKTMFTCSLLHSLLNIGAAFSVSWEMFAAFRFFLGSGIGGILVVSFPYSLEFITLKWRPLVGVLPVWPCGALVFSVAAYILDDWSHLHIACGAISLPVMLTFISVPESARWLATQGRVKEAEEIFDTISKMNGKTPPTQTKTVLQKIYAEELESRTSGKKYTYWDLFNNWKTAKITLIFCYVWLTLCVVYYGISFGVSALSGNLFLNIFLLSVVEVPGFCSILYFNNKIGRKWTNVGMFSVAAISACGCLVVYFALSSDERKNWITAFTLIIKMAIGAAWSASEIWVGETYPTVIRSIGFGILNSVARVGGILAPFIIDLDDRQLLAYFVIAGTVVLTVVVSLFVPETRGKQMEESINVPSRTETGSDIKMSVATVGNGDHLDTSDIKMSVATVGNGDHLDTSDIKMSMATVDGIKNSGGDYRHEYEF